MAGYFEQVLWDTHREAVKKVAGKPGYDLNGGRIRIGGLRFSKGTSPFDRDWRVVKEIVSDSIGLTQIKSLQGKTVVRQERVCDSYVFLTSEREIFGVYLSHPSYEEESAQLYTGAGDWDDLAALDLLPQDLMVRAKLESMCIEVWDHFKDHRDDIITAVHQIRGLGDSHPLPLSMRCVYEQYGIPENLW